MILCSMSYIMFRTVVLDGCQNTDYHYIILLLQLQQFLWFLSGKQHLLLRET